MYGSARPERTNQSDGELNGFVAGGNTSQDATRQTGNQQLPEDFSVGIPLQMLSNRPDVRSAEFFFSAGVLYDECCPCRFLSFHHAERSAGWTNSAGSMIINPGKFVASAVASLTQPLFNKGVNIAQLKIAKAQQEEARLSFEQTLLNAGVEVNGHWCNIRRPVRNPLSTISRSPLCRLLPEALVC